MTKGSTYNVMVMVMESSYTEENNARVKNKLAEEVNGLWKACVQMVGGLTTSLVAMSSQLDHPTIETNKMRFFRVWKKFLYGTSRSTKPNHGTPTTCPFYLRVLGIII